MYNGSCRHKKCPRKHIPIAVLQTKPCPFESKCKYIATRGCWCKHPDPAGFASTDLEESLDCSDFTSFVDEAILNLLHDHSSCPIQLQAGGGLKDGGEEFREDSIKDGPDTSYNDLMDKVLEIIVESFSDGRPSSCWEYDDWIEEQTKILQVLHSDLVSGKKQSQSRSSNFQSFLL